MLTALIEAVHDQAVERGEPLAGLTASEGGIYRRFGYGVATLVQWLRVDARRSAELPPLDGGAVGGRMRFVGEPEAGEEVRTRIVGPDEIDREPGFISMDSSLARALRGRGLDEEISVALPSGRGRFVIVEVTYPGP